MGHPDEEKKWRLDYRLQLLGTALSVIVIAVGAWQFYLQQEQIAEDEKQTAQVGLLQESTRKMWEQKSKVYGEICNAAGRMVSSDDTSSSAFLKARNDFFGLYWGETMMVQTDSIRWQLQKLRKALDDYRAGSGDDHGLKELTKELGFMCRRDLDRVWKELDAKVEDIY